MLICVILSIVYFNTSSFFYIVLTERKNLGLISFFLSVFIPSNEETKKTNVCMGKCSKRYTNNTLSWYI